MKYILNFFIIILFISCEGDVEYSGKIYDAKTKEPIDSVKCVIVQFAHMNNFNYSDSLGNYNVITPLVGCVPDCDDYSVEFSKKGYKTQIKYAPTDIYLEKE